MKRTQRPDISTKNHARRATRPLVSESDLAESGLPGIMWFSKPVQVSREDLVCRSVIIRRLQAKECSASVIVSDY